MASVERVLPSVPPALGRASWTGALQQASLLTLNLASLVPSPTVSLEQSLPKALRQPLAQASPPSWKARISLKGLVQALVQVSL
jgi:hypothetical protein